MNLRTTPLEVAVLLYLLALVFGGLALSGHWFGLALSALLFFTLAVVAAFSLRKSLRSGHVQTGMGPGTLRNTEPRLFWMQIVRISVQLLISGFGFVYFLVQAFLKYE